MGPIVAGAVITSNGKLAKDFEYIAELRRAQQRVIIPGDFQAQKKVSGKHLGSTPLRPPFIKSLAKFELTTYKLADGGDALRNYI
jgi:hypothetical protein